MRTNKAAYCTDETYNKYMDSLREKMFEALAGALKSDNSIDQSLNDAYFWARKEALKDAETVQALRSLREKGVVR